MKKTRKHRTKFISNTILITIFIIMTALAVTMYFIDDLALRFNTVVTVLTEIENAIYMLSKQAHITGLIAIFCIFVAKCSLPIPLTMIFVITGMMYDTKTAFLVNIFGMVFVMTVKYLEGYAFGGGVAEKLIDLGTNKFMRRVIEFDGIGNPYVLLASRLIPFISVNLVSRVYGGLRSDYFYYICISVIGIMPRLYVATQLGHSIFNPFSRQFVFILMIIVLFFGISAFVSNIFYGNKVNVYEQMFMFTDKKQKYKIVFLGE